MKQIPRQYVDTSNNGKIMPQLVEPPNPEYILYLLEKKQPATRDEAMMLVMTDFRGTVNPSMVDVIVEEHFANE